jgi:O-antigen/teichoic acid export membrane protein
LTSDAAEATGYAPVPEEPAARSNDLFGRGMLYVVIWSFQVIAATVVSPILTYTLGPAEFGYLASAIALYQVLIVLSVFGLDQALQLQRAEDHTGNSARGILLFGVCVAFLMTGLAAATSPLWATELGFPGAGGLVTVTLLWTAPGASVMMVLALLQSEDRLKAFATVSVISTVGGQLFGIGLMLLLGRTAFHYALGGVISQFLAIGIGLVLAKPKLRGLRQWPITYRAIRIGIPLMLAGLSIFILNAGDRFIIQRFLGSEEVGRFQLAYTIGYVIVLILSFTNRAWVPRLAAIEDPHERWLVVRQSRDGIYRLLIPAILGVTLAAPLLLRIVAPASFRPDSLLLIVFLVALAAFPVTAVGASGRMSLTLRRSRALAVGAFVAVVVKIAVNLALIPYLGTAGAAIGTVLAFSAQAWVQSSAIPKKFAGERPSWGLIAQCTGACLLAGSTVLLPQTPVWIGVRIVLGLACLPWFLVRLREAKNGEATEGSHRCSAKAA